MEITPFLPLWSPMVTSVIQNLGAIAFPIMSQKDARELAAHARQLEYVEQKPEFGPRKVKQAVWSARVVQGSVLADFADQTEVGLTRFFGRDAFAPSLAFNNLNVQRYTHGTLGIEAHQDNETNKNLVVLVALDGTGEFAVYDCLGGKVRVRWQLVPGTALLMLAPGFCGASVDDRPVHSVGEIVGDPYRYVLGLRQTILLTRKG